MWLYHYKEKSIEEIQELLFVSSRTVRRYLALFDETGNVSPVVQQHGPTRAMDAFEEMSLIQSLLNKPDMYLEELRQELIQISGTDVSVSTICKTLKHLGFSRKKLRQVALRRSEERRQEFMEEMAYLDADMLVWLDECGSTRRYEVRKYEYSLRGLTPISYKLLVRGQRLSAIPVVTTRGIEDVFITNNSVNGDLFLQFVEQCLVPVLQLFNRSNARSVVIMDNASIHHVARVVDRISQTGAIILFLPPYIPDFNPAEEVVSKVVSKVKKFLVNNDVAYSTTTSPTLLLMTMAYNTVTTTVVPATLSMQDTKTSVILLFFFWFCYSIQSCYILLTAIVTCLPIHPDDPVSLPFASRIVPCLMHRSQTVCEVVQFD